jgi:digeranylgeranylglycerophospholipid reductase
MNDSHCLESDIAIVGGGLAGLCTALTIAARTDARLIMIDEDIGSNRSLPLTFLDTVQQFDLEESLLQRYHGFAMRTRTGHQALHMFDDTPLVTLDYSAACGQLYARLQAYPRFTHLPTRATGLSRNRAGWRVHSQGQDDVACRLLVDASGHAHFTARQLKHAVPAAYSHSYGRILEGCSVPADEASVALFLTGNPRHGSGGGWFYPLPGQRVSFGFATVTATPQYPAEECRQGFESALREFSPHAEMMRGAVAGDVHAGSIPLGPVKRLVYDGLMLVGDAAGQATPWACMGAEPALLNGQLCGRAAVGAFRERDFSRARLRDYERLWKTQNGTGYRQAMMLADLEWQRGETAWDDTVNRLDRLSDPEMLHSLRHNTPYLPLPLIWWLLVYDRLGLIRRGIRDRLARRLTLQQVRGY